jgi:hypothetical protein
MTDSTHITVWAAHVLAKGEAVATPTAKDGKMLSSVTACGDPWLNPEDKAFDMFCAKKALDLPSYWRPSDEEFANALKALCPKCKVIFDAAMEGKLL